MKIFMSSTHIDLIEYRKEANLALSMLSHRVISGELLSPPNEEPVAADILGIDDCDIFVGVYAHRYGASHGENGDSITEQEFDYALKAGKQIIALFVDKKYPWPAQFIERNKEKSDRLKKFTVKVRTHAKVNYFTDKADLVHKIVFLVEGRKTPPSRATITPDRKTHEDNHLALLARISDYALNTSDLDSIFHLVLTAVTSSYGLGFNRACLFLLDEKHEVLKGILGIGQLDVSSAYRDWESDPHPKLANLDGYLEMLSKGLLVGTPVGERIKDLKLPLNRANPDVLTRAVIEQRSTTPTQEELDRLSDEFKSAFQPTLPLIVTPLKARGKALGILVADNKFNSAAVTDENTTMLNLLANSLSMAIENAQYLHEIVQAKYSVRKQQPLPINQKTLDVFIVMPFAQRYQTFYKEVIKKTIEDMNLVCKRADDFFQSSVIMNDIMACIDRAATIVADFSGRSPNVFFEVGIAHALRKNVVLITQDLQDVPPKLQVIRCHIYRDDLSGAREFPQVLRKALLDVKENKFSIFNAQKLGNPDKHMCLVLTPNSENGKKTYGDLLQDVLKSFELNCIQVNEIFDSNSLLDQIWSQINRAGIVISDLTDRDPDVFYLTGLAYGLRKNIVFISQRNEDIPFDLKKGSCLIYSLSTYGEGKSAQEKLQRIVGDIMTR